MEQRLVDTYLRPGLVERASAVGIGALGIGTGILLAAWGISLLWRYTPPEIAVRIGNPELHVAQESPLKVTQDKPFILAKPEALKIDPAQLTVKVEESPHTLVSGAGTDTKVGEGDLIRRELTVFSNVRHELGTVVTGWNYRDGTGGVPFQQFCYYTAPNVDRTSKRVDIAFDRVPSPVGAGLVPNLEEALAKCRWWQE